MRVTILCFCGISTGIITAGIKRLQKPDDTIEACEYTGLAAVLERSDVILLSPQLRGKYEETAALCRKMNIGCGVINKELYMTMDAASIYSFAEEISNSKSSTQ